ncbi:MAG: acyl-ACP--UDP-N-acetylglucosamine O-acyltransferase [Elusimicrobiaceae bacterium]|nr:acyl-ACP--UDP-N-acetylglucosamine O-acyltransferase [Elusimicrobiaceae bacterium]
MTAKIHPTAIIHPGAVLGEDVEVGPYAVIGEDVKIGAGTKVGPHCFIEFATIGKNNNFVAACYVGTPPQDYSYSGQKTTLVMGDNNIVREGVTLHRGSPKHGETVIGGGCMFMANSHVGHDCQLGSRIIMVNSAGFSGHVEVGDSAVISGLSGFHQFCRVGRMAMVGGGSMSGKDIPPFCIVQGDRAHLVGLNLVGMRRNGISRESIRSVRETYKELFLRGMRLSEAIGKLKGANLSPEAREMVEFCEKGTRGIMRARMSCSRRAGNDGEE